VRGFRLGATALLAAVSLGVALLPSATSANSDVSAIRRPQLTLTPDSGAPGIKFAASEMGSPAPLGTSISIKYAVTSSKSVVLCVVGINNRSGMWRCGGTIPNGKAAGKPGKHAVIATDSNGTGEGTAVFTLT
jgi:hypothetical protein